MSFQLTECVKGASNRTILHAGTLFFCPSPLKIPSPPPTFKLIHLMSLHMCISARKIKNPNPICQLISSFIHCKNNNLTARSTAAHLLHHLSWITFPCNHMIYVSCDTVAYRKRLAADQCTNTLGPYSVQTPRPIRVKKPNGF